MQGGTCYETRSTMPGVNSNYAFFKLVGNSVHAVWTDKLRAGRGLKYQLFHDTSNFIYTMFTCLHHFYVHIYL